MLEDFHNKMLYVFVFYNLFFKIQRTHFLYSCRLMIFLCLVKHLGLIVQELVNQLLEILLNIVKHDQFSCLVNIRTLFDRSDCLHWNEFLWVSLRFQSNSLVWINYCDKGNHIWKFMEVEVLLSNLLIVTVVDIKHFLVLFDNSCKLVYISAHVQLWTIHKYHRFLVEGIVRMLRFQDFPEFAHTWVEIELVIILNSIKCLVEYFVCKFLSNKCIFYVCVLHFAV